MADTTKNTYGTGAQTPSSTTSPSGGNSEYSAGRASQGGQTTSASAARPAREQSSQSSKDNEWAQNTKDNIERGVKKGAEMGAEVIDKAKENLTDAYDRASKGVTETWGQAVDYTRSNPGTATLVAFGAGIGVGLLIANSVSSRSRAQRIAPPVIRALSEIAAEFFG